MDYWVYSDRWRVAVECACEIATCAVERCGSAGTSGSVGATGRFRVGASYRGRDLVTYLIRECSERRRAFEFPVYHVWPWD